MSCLSCTRVPKNSDEDLNKKAPAETKSETVAVTVKAEEAEQQTMLNTSGLDRPVDSVPIPNVTDLTESAKELIKEAIATSTPAAESFDDESKFISLDTEEINKEKKLEEVVSGSGANKKAKNKNKKKAKKSSRKGSLEEEEKAADLRESTPVVGAVIGRIASPDEKSPEVREIYSFSKFELFLE